MDRKSEVKRYKCEVVFYNLMVTGSQIPNPLCASTIGF